MVGVERDTVTTNDTKIRLVGFDPDSTVDVRQFDEQTWTVLRALIYRGKVDDFEVPVDGLTDFASVPRIFVWFLPRYGRYTRAAILHDYLWSVAVPAGRLTRLDADGIFRAAMRQLEVPFLRRWIMWAAVRWGALTKPDGRRGWWKEAWRVALVTAVALPIVAPAAIVIMLTLPVFYLLELLLWLPLAANRALRTRHDQPAKKVNKPELRETI
ncbi:MAG TPA: DUF1353 domain-containing protein [Micromonosporaceae bacterium]|nr:DUF1353 domain-containing protein [Micromonosporaceae bacterium]